MSPYFFFFFFLQNNGSLVWCQNHKQCSKVRSLQLCRYFLKLNFGIIIKSWEVAKMLQRNHMYSSSCSHWYLHLTYLLNDIKSSKGDTGTVHVCGSDVLAHVDSMSIVTLAVNKLSVFLSTTLFLSLFCNFLNQKHLVVQPEDLLPSTYTSVTLYAVL